MDEQSPIDIDNEAKKSFEYSLDVRLAQHFTSYYGKGNEMGLTFSISIIAEKEHNTYRRKLMVKTILFF